jgi:Aldo/keto reductase family
LQNAGSSGHYDGQVFADEYHSQSLFEAAPQLLQRGGFLGARQNTLGDQSQVDDADTPLDETLEACAQLIQQGKVRAIGASNYNPKRLGESAADPQEKPSGARVCSRSTTFTSGRGSKRSWRFFACAKTTA